ncbi:putative membrane protein [Paenibacillus algicola]|uniref:Putative membrane protein n=1 Tax=Paenibacillus algicola TaxID=2565926 RepID=A0A4V1G4G9_9BACL|nr:hypothetical protein [Paenibacillus algicola]QCT04654.1 putative membrane protein [Paenibacillus algicola]
MSTAIHEYRERKMQPFYWILTFEMMIIGMLLGLALVVGPVILLTLWPSGWMALTLLAIPLGLWMIRSLWRSLATRIWHNRHNDYFAIYEDVLRYTVWDRETREEQSGSIRLKDISEMYYGRHVMMYSYAYKETSFRERAPQVELWPVIHLIYNSGGGEKMISVPLAETREANEWLKTLAPHGIPLWLSSVVVVDEDEAAIYVLREEENRGAAVFENNIERAFRPFIEKKVEEEEQRAPGPEELEALDAEIRRIEEQEAQQAQKAVFANVGPLGWMVFVLQFFLSWLIMNQAVAGRIDPDGVIIPVLLMLVMSFLFFFLVKRLRWPHLLVCWGGLFVTQLVLDMIAGSSEEGSALYSIGGGLIGMSMVAPVFIWLPYLLALGLRRRRDGAKARHHAVQNSG